MVSLFLTFYFLPICVFILKWVSCKKYLVESDLLKISSDHLCLLLWLFGWGRLFACERISIFSPGWPGTCYAAQADP
jgi:hypothetical protein